MGLGGYIVIMTAFVKFFFTLDGPCPKKLMTKGQFHRAAKQRFLLSKIFLLSNLKQTTSQLAYILYESLVGNQRNPLSKLSR